MRDRRRFRQSVESRLLAMGDREAATALDHYRRQHGPKAARNLAGEYLARHDQERPAATRHVGRQFLICTDLLVDWHLRNRDQSEASILIEETHKLFPESTTILRCRAKLEKQRRNHLLAEEYACQAVAKSHGQDVKAVALLANILCDNRQPEKAFEFLFPIAAKRFDPRIMLALRRIAAEEVGRKEYSDLVDRYYHSGSISEKGSWSIRHEARRVDRAEMTGDQRKLDPRRLLDHSRAPRG